MKFELRNRLGVNILLEQAVIASIDSPLMSLSGHVMESSDTAPVLRVNTALVESVQQQRGATSTTVELGKKDFGFGLLAIRSEDHLAMLLFDLARKDVCGWLETAAQQEYLPVVLAAKDRAVQVRLPVDSHVRELRDAGRRYRCATKEEQFTSFSLILDLLENIEFLDQLSIDPKTLDEVNLLVLGPMDKSLPTSAKSTRDERANLMH